MFSGTGPRNIGYSVQGGFLFGTRDLTISVRTAPSARIKIFQDALLFPAHEGRPASAVTSELSVTGGAGQIVWDGASVTYAAEGTSAQAAPLTPGTHRVEAQLVSADGKPGTWRFSFGRVVKGLRPVSGKVDAATPDGITFRLSGRPGERVVFVFDAEP